jgi:signal transduction histidine kinase
MMIRSTSSSSFTDSAHEALSPSSLASSLRAPNLPALEDVLEQFCFHRGLYSKGTFQSLTASLLKLIREQKTQGVLITLAPTQDDQNRLASSLNYTQGVQWVDLRRLQEQGQFRLGMEGPMGLFLILGDRLSACVFWNHRTEDMFRTLYGGWSFHPGDVRAMGQALAEGVLDPALQDAIRQAPIDRRYDENLTSLISNLVTNLESRNRDLSLALDRESHLTQKVVQSERLAAIGQLSSVVAHEIRNPLGLISIYIKLAQTQLEKSPLELEAIQAHLAQIQGATESLDGILTELTQYARPVQLQLQRVNLMEQIQSLCEFVRPSYQEKAVTLELVPLAPVEESTKDSGVEDTPPPVWIEIDTLRFRQALLNLLKNALEVSEPKQTVRVTLTARRNDGSLYVRVQDQGPGISEAVQRKLFTPFFSTKSSGTGLGLAQVRKIMQAHGGDVVLLGSEAGKGSTFSLILPMASTDNG